MRLIPKITEIFFKAIDYLAERFDLPTSYNDPRSPVYQALKPDIETAKRLTKRAEEVFAEGETEKAINILRYVHAKFPDFYPALNDMGVIMLAAGEIEKAVALFSRAYRLCRTDMDLLSNYAKALKRLGRHKEAEELLKRAKV